MKINYILTEKEATDIVRGVLYDRTPEDQTVGTIEIEKAPVPYNNHSLNRQEVSSANKIWLIKMVRQLSFDLDKGTIKVPREVDHPEKPQCLGLADSKNWVEKYLETNSRD